MKAARIGLALAMLTTLGAGCSLPVVPNLSFFPKDLPATEVTLANSSTIKLEQISLNPLEHLEKQPARTITISDWASGDHVAFDWNETYERETAASITARNEAERATGVGEEPQVPEPVYETITLKGSLKTDALDDGQRISLPSEWSEQDVDLSGGPNTIVWLSKAQYDELVATRHTHLSIGVFDQGLQTAANAAEAIKGLIAKISGSNDTASVSDQDVTEIEASPDWGSYVMLWQGDKVRVETIQAENKFASYTILANPDNPLILKVELKAWAYGTEALGVLSDDLQISGYSITEITSP